MSKKNTIKISFPNGGIIPGAVLDQKNDRSCDAGEIVSVPESYGRHVIDDRFAVEANDAAKDKKEPDLIAPVKDVGGVDAKNHELVAASGSQD